MMLSGTTAPVTDALGSTVALTDSNGTVQTQYTYEPFGDTTASGTASDNAQKYTGREDDGTGLYYYRARYYSPTLQRFIGEDPIGFSAGINVYRYVKDNPTNLVDPDGLAEIYYWAPYGQSIKGHAALRLCDGTYISYWPAHPDRWSGFQPLNRDAVRPANFDRDKAEEAGREPERLPLCDLDEAAIKAWWNNGQGHGSFSDWNNCAAIVAEALHAGEYPEGPVVNWPDNLRAQYFALGGRKWRKAPVPRRFTFADK